MNTRTLRRDRNTEISYRHPKSLKEIAAYANAKGIPVHTHTYGDGACRAVIDAYIYAEERSGKKIHNTMAHVRNITPEDVRRCAEHDIGIAENMIWHCMDIPEEEYRAYAPGELLTVREALQCLTIDGARQLGIGEKCGSVKVGKNADFVILDTDFLDFEGEALRTIHRTKIKNVYFEGREVL